MGIEDFSLEDSGEHADSILLVCQQDATRESIAAILRKRRYAVTECPSLDEARKEAGSKLFDCLVLEESAMPDGLGKVYEDLSADTRLGLMPTIIIHEKPTSLPANRTTLVVISSPVSPAELLVKLSTMLRLRKIQAENAEFESQVAAQNAQLRDLTRRFRQELKEARSIQRAILPRSLPADKKCYFATTYIPLEAVAGDIFDVWGISESTYGLFIGDVTGHGLPAAFIAAMTKMALAYAPKHCPGAMLTEMAKGLHPLMPEGRFVTAAAAIYNTEDSTLAIARAGHPSPYIFRAGTKEVETITPRGLPLGILAESRYEVYTTHLESGDKLLLVTDGLTEASNMSGAMLGTQGLADFFAEAAPDLHIDACIRQILQLFNGFTEGRRIKDDNTLLGLECA